MFWVTGAILVTGALLFTFFAKGDVQPWALVEPSRMEGQASKSIASVDNSAEKITEKTPSSTTPAEVAFNPETPVEEVKDA